MWVREVAANQPGTCNGHRPTGLVAFSSSPSGVADMITSSAQSIKSVPCAFAYLHQQFPRTIAGDERGADQKGGSTPETEDTPALRRVSEEEPVRAIVSDTSGLSGKSSTRRFD